MNRIIANALIKKGHIAELGHAYLFKVDGTNLSHYAKGTYVVRYADREETFRNFRDAYSCAYQNNTNTYNVVNYW